MENGSKRLSVIIIGIICAIYVISPMDLVPMCPVDDILAIIVAIATITRTGRKQLPGE